MTTKYQKFEAKDILRSQIRNAPYNPRIIDDAERKRLKRNLKKVGLLTTLVWNQRTGNLVSGHQRIALLDDLEGGKDYSITMAVVDLDEKTEREQNIFMNSTSAQGRFDFDKLNLMLPDIDYSNAGLSEYDLHIIGYEDAASMAETAALHEVNADMDDLYSDEDETDDYEDRKAAVKAEKQRIAEQAASKADEGESYVTISFSSYKEKAAFMRRWNYPVDDLFVKGELFSKKISGK
jgi:hypothetical protein